ncbi:MAG: molybdopterin-synthase adenylyltransferase MoeB [Gammaproteobacteria bacterium]
MNDPQLLRYSRQIMLPQIDVVGQDRLLNSTVLIVGLGGLGCAAAAYLAAAGVGHLILADFDTVELSNLQRQILHHTDDIGRTKVESSAATLRQINPDISITKFAARLDDESLQALLPQVDLVLDGCDNFATRFAVNRACVSHHKPLVSGAAIRFEGQVSVFMNQGRGTPCYQCLYKADGEEDQNCTDNGVLAPLVGIIGAIQATEAIKVLIGIGEALTDRLLLLDALHMEWRTLRLKQDPACPVCSG